MSKSLTINAPQIVQTRNTLNAVPSGSTATPDENVKYVPQDLTEEQQAQARQNIGAAAAGETGGSAPELDEYFTIYPSGDTTLSAEAGNINEVWMDGYERSSQEGVYSLNANSVVRVKATNNVCFNFSNTTDEIWIYVPKGIVLSEPIYGVRENVNLVYWNISKNAQTMNFGGYVWLMTNVLFNGMFSTSNKTVFVVSGDTLDYTGVDGVSESDFTSGMYCKTSAFVNLPRNTYQYGVRGFSYESIVQHGHKLELKFADLNENECLQLVYSSMNTNVRRIVGNLSGYQIQVWQNGKMFKPNFKATSDSDLSSGEYYRENSNPWSYRFKTWKPQDIINSSDNNKTTIYVQFLIKVNDWNRWNFTTADACQGMILPESYRMHLGDAGYSANRCDFSALNGTLIYPKQYQVSGGYQGSLGQGTFTKVVLLNKESKSVDIPDTCTEAIVTWDAVPDSVHDCWKKTTLTKIWMPRATYDLAVVDANWSAYASKLFPYDDLTFGPDNYVEPIVKVQSDWNQSDTTAPDYIKNKPTIPTSDDFNADDVFTFYWDNMSEGTVAAILRTDGSPKTEYIYENGVKAVYNSTATKAADLAVGEYGEWGLQTWYKFREPVNKLNVLKIRFSNKSWQTYNITNGKCIGMVIPNEPAKWNMEWNGHYYDRMSTSYLNYTVIFPKWITSIATGNAPDTTKQVVLCTNPTQVRLVGSSVTELILTNTSVPATVYDAVQNSNVTKVWLPRATYELAIVDANWSAYASKLFPYDFLSFGPDNYVMPVALS